MEFQQIYNEDDIKFIHKVFCKKNVNMSQFGRCMVIVVSSISIICLMNSIAIELILFIVGVLSCITIEDSYRLIADYNKRRNVYKMLYQKYSNPVTVRFEDIFLMYRDTKYYYDNITYIIYCGKYMFIFCAGKFIPLIYNSEMNQLILGKVKQYPNIEICRMEKVFSMDYYNRLS